MHTSIIEINCELISNEKQREANVLREVFLLGLVILSSSYKQGQFQYGVVLQHGKHPCDTGWEVTPC